MQGGTSPVVYSAGYCEKEDFENQYERDLLIRDGAWVKRSLQGRRRTADGPILRNARFIWGFMDRDGGRSELTLGFLAGIFVSILCPCFSNKVIKRPQKTIIKIF